MSFGKIEYDGEMTDKIREQVKLLQVALDKAWWNLTVYGTVELPTRIHKQPTSLSEARRFDVMSRDKKQAMVTVGGKPWRCPICRANVFTKVEEQYTCNGCGSKWIGE